MKRTLAIAIAALLAVTSAQAQASGTATKPKTAEWPPKQLVLPSEQNTGERLAVVTHWCFGSVFQADKKRQK